MSGDPSIRVSNTGCAIVRPQAASNKSVVESVVDFFTEVVPQAYSGSQKTDDREKVLWVQFDQADINDLVNNPNYTSCGSCPPLLLTLGYSNGVQVWLILPSGEAQEVLSLKQGPVQVFKVLPNPQPASDLVVDRFVRKRPLVAVCDNNSPGQSYCSVKFLSLRTGEEAHNISFKNRVHNVLANRRIVVVTFLGRIAVFDACHFKERFCVTSCYPSSDPNLNPIALGDRWLAYADKKLVAVHQSGGGVTGNGGQSYAATVISAAEKVTKGLTLLGETVISSVTGTKSHHSTTSKPVKQTDHSGVVTIVDVERCSNEVKVQEDCDDKGVVAHFPAHVNEPIAAMEFNPSGMLLLTACALGHNFHVFHILAHPWSSSQAAVHHLYTLHRGDTTAKVQNITFTFDSRWVAVSTLRGTTHVFPITPYGGPVGVRTHVGTKVVNRASRFHKSAGLDDIRRPSATKTGSPGTGHDTVPVLAYHSPGLRSTSNPRLPPYPHPHTIHPHIQINRHPLTLPGGVATCQTKSTNRQSSSGVAESAHIAAQFAITRGWVAGMTPNRGSNSDEPFMDSLFVAGFDGTLVEYVLDPRPKAALDKVTDDSPIEVVVTPKAQWVLQRSITSEEVKPPLNDNNPLLTAHDAVLLQQPTFTDVTENTDLRYGSKDSLSSDVSGKSDADDQWLSQVEIVTHTGPHRRLWMGPQFKFKTYHKEQNTTILGSNSPSLLSHSPESHSDLMCDENDLQSLSIQPEPTRSNPVAMPGGRSRALRGSGSDTYSPSTAPFIEAGSLEASPHLIEVYGSWPGSSSDSEEVLRETLADAMIETRSGKNSVDHHDSIDNMSSSSSSNNSASRTLSSDVRPSSPHVMLFPTNNGVL